MIKETSLIGKSSIQSAMTTNKVKQATITVKRTGPAVAKYPTTNTRQIQFELDLMDLIGSCTALSIVAKPAFVSMIQHLDSCVNIPTRQTVANKIGKYVKQNVRLCF